MTRRDPEHHDGTSVAPPGGGDTERRPGEALFSIALLIASLALLWSAYGIAGFESLSSPGAVPMATTAAMVISAALVTLRTLRLPLNQTETVLRDILPPVVIVFVVLLTGFGIALKPLGFLPTAALFLIVAIKLLGKRSWGWTLLVALGSLLVIWLVFRIIFTVLMPAGLVPEAEVIQYFRSMFSGGGA